MERVGVLNITDYEYGYGKIKLVRQFSLINTSNITLPTRKE